MIRSLDSELSMKTCLQRFQTFYSKLCSRLARVVSLTHTITFPKIFKKKINRFSAIIVEREKNIPRAQRGRALTRRRRGASGALSLLRNTFSLSLSLSRSHGHCLSTRYSKNTIFQINFSQQLLDLET